MLLKLIQDVHLIVKSLRFILNVQQIVHYILGKTQGVPVLKTHSVTIVPPTVLALVVRIAVVHLIVSWNLYIPTALPIVISTQEQMQGVRAVISQDIPIVHQNVKKIQMIQDVQSQIAQRILLIEDVHLIVNHLLVKIHVVHAQNSPCTQIVPQIAVEMQEKTNAVLVHNIPCTKIVPQTVNSTLEKTPGALAAEIPHIPTVRPIAPILATLTQDAGISFVRKIRGILLVKGSSCLVSQGFLF